MKLEFEWDEKKNARNIIKHGISFKEAVMVFSDSMRIEEFDYYHNWIEERWIITGLVGCNVIVVVCTYRGGKIRIISARQTTKKEEEAYFYGYGAIYFN